MNDDPLPAADLPFPCVGFPAHSPTPPHLSLRLTCDQTLGLAPSPCPKKRSLVRWPRMGALALDRGPGDWVLVPDVWLLLAV